MKVIKTEDAIGMVLGHDITEIVPGEFKGVAFKKGHMIKSGDIDRLLRIGKEHVYIMELNENVLHEDDAIRKLGEYYCGKGVYLTEPIEGKINIQAEHRGLLKINRGLLDELNELGDIIIATVHGNRVIQKHGLIAGSRVIPLVIEKEKIKEAIDILEKKGSLFQVKPFKEYKAAVIVTGSEVYKGRIKDMFGPVVQRKLKEFHTEIIYEKIVPNEIFIIKDSILEAKANGAELILVTGGMSVDPDDKTPGAIKESGAEIISYGTPVLPGAMLLVSYLDDIPVLGLPGCVMFSHRTAFDILLPRIMAGERIVRRDITGLGYGGQCLKCNVCNFPECHFGKS